MHDKFNPKSGEEFKRYQEVLLSNKGEQLNGENKTLRDEFAMKAIATFSFSIESNFNHYPELARVAYEMADAMLLERLK